MIITLIKHLVEKEGITVPSSPAMGLQVPMDGFDLWVAKLNQESYSPRTTNPINGVKSIKARKQERGLPTEEQIKKLLTYRYYRKEQRQRFQLLVVLLITTGLRITEAVSILKQDIKLDRHEIRVIGKGSKERVVPILPVADALMRDYLPADNSPYLFPARNAKGYRDISSIEKVFRRVAGITPHQLRHYFATSSLKSGAKLEVVSRTLGHALWNKLRGNSKRVPGILLPKAIWHLG